MKIEDLRKLIERVDKMSAQDEQLDFELTLVELLIRVLVSSRKLRRELLEAIFPELLGRGPHNTGGNPSCN